MRQDGFTGDILICDCDVHQGNGTASILQQSPDIFTFSIHGEKNFPFRKTQSDLDVGLEDGTGDGEYLDALESALDDIVDQFHPGLVIYLAGADPFQDDRLGRLAFSKDGLLARDRLVFSTFLKLGIPTAVTMSGGYARDIADIVEIHYGTLKTGLEVWSQNLTRA
jgi:acetoin utilization deacetylase AcuC-like enzyme